MAEAFYKKDKATSQDMTDIKNQIKDLEKQKKQLQAQVKLKENAEKWQRQTEIKQKVLKALEGVYKIFEDSKYFNKKVKGKSGLDYVISRPDYYLYELKTKEGGKTVVKRATSTTSDEWIIQYLKKNGDKNKLMETAQASLAKTWARLNAKKSRRKSSTTKKDIDGQKKSMSDRFGGGNIG